MNGSRLSEGNSTRIISPKKDNGQEKPGNIDMLYLNNDAWDPLEIFRVTP